MRASIKNLVIAEGNHNVNWPTAPLVDAPLEMPLTLSISRQNLALGRMEHKACAIAQSCREKNYSYFAIGVDMAWIGAFSAGKPVRLRYRSGNLPKKFDAAIKKLDETGVFDVRHLETDKYVLKPPTENYTLEYKKAQNSAHSVSTKTFIKKRPNNKKKNVKEFEGRGRLHG